MLCWILWVQNHQTGRYMGTHRIQNIHSPQLPTAKLTKDWGSQALSRLCLVECTQGCFELENLQHLKPRFPSPQLGLTINSVCSWPGQSPLESPKILTRQDLCNAFCQTLSLEDQQGSGKLHKVLGPHNATGEPSGSSVSKLLSSESIRGTKPRQTWDNLLHLHVPVR